MASQGAGSTGRQTLPWRRRTGARVRNPSSNSDDKRRSVPDRGCGRLSFLRSAQFCDRRTTTTIRTLRADGRDGTARLPRRPPRRKPGRSAGEGRRIGIVARREGNFEVVTYDRSDPDQSRLLLKLTAEEADQLQAMEAPTTA